jgi:signal transduction histidine kinase
LASAGNWYRVAVSLPSIALTGAIAVQQVVDAARSSIAGLATLEASLLSTERLLVQEVQSVSNIDRITARASDLEALGRMTGAVAHDVNNSLQAITAWASTLVEQRHSEASTGHKEALTAINQAVEHAEALLSDLDISRLGPHQRSVVDVGSETQRVSRLLRALLGSRHQLKIRTADGAPVVTNAHMLHRALFNLVANARDAMASPGTCIVSVDCTASQVRVSVEDNGAGMDEVTRQRLFEAYFTTKGPRGNGLGLCSVTKLLSESNGSVDTWSQLGRGTRITLTLPRAERVGPPLQPVLG